jgi:chaperone required for assembly of F1-ATPase
VRRFYQLVSVSPTREVRLDGKPVRTPAKKALRLPTSALAEAVAEEWRIQGPEMNLHDMRLTKLANTAIDRVGSDRNRILAEMVEYAGSDLVCYRADRPPDLVAEQQALWDPVIAWASDSLGIFFETIVGVVHRRQADEALQAVGSRIAGRDDFSIAALHSLATLTGSALIALMLDEGAMTPEGAWKAAHADEDYQIRHWGWDEEARTRRASRLLEFSSTCRFLELVRA